MMKNITLGQFMPGDSVIHRLDPRCKLGLTLAYIVAIFLVQGVLGYVFSAALVILVASLAHIPLKYLARGLKPLRWIIAFTAVLNLFMTGGEEVLFTIWKIRATMDGLRNALFFSFRLIFLVLGTSVLTLTTSPIVLTDALERALSPLKVFKFPAHELAMMMTIALRFIPTLTEEAQKILNAQSARGADFESGNLFARARAMVPLLVPLFVSAFRRAGDLAMAMEARCYHGGEGRTRMRVLRYTYKDLVAVGVMALYIALVVLEGVLL
ncbi:MAG TPA: energy-coupling factor transporter transmembrane protein EcfT [Candidatus Aphodomonas merdavium]|nr:energy-coupling factor transporter transmembrane protein EcfT [Candidatus Aphodomonas merdavium]